MFTRKSSYPTSDSLAHAGHLSPVRQTPESDCKPATANRQPLFGLHAPGGTTPRWLIEPFQPISLTHLDAKADMLDRRDNKYVVRADILQLALGEMIPQFDILEIDCKRDFTYDTCYFDDAERSAYFDHHKGRRIRCKVRMRKYVDAGLCFVEVKLKHMRGMTIKERLRCPVEMYGKMNDEAMQFVASSYRELYGRAYNRELRPTVEMRYQRATLVAKQGGERVTIDTGIVFEGTSGSQTIDSDLILVEVKSGNANGIADKILRRLHQHPTNTCSKYCVAMAALNEVSKTNKFLVPLRRLGVVPTSSGAWLAKPSQLTVRADSIQPHVEIW
jgi:hypothetical protein